MAKPSAFLYLVRKPVVTDEPPAVAGVDFDYQPSPVKLAVWDVFRGYLTEHVIPEHCDLKRSLYCCMRWLALFDPMQEASTVDRAQGREYTRTRLADGVSAATIRRELCIIGAAFAHAVEEERLAKVPKFQVPDPNPPRIRWLTPEEWTQLRISPKATRIHCFALVAFLTGCRSQAIEQLTWDRVDFEARTMDFRLPGVNHKKKRRPIAPINDELLPRLRGMYERRKPGDPYVIGAGPRGRPSSTYLGMKAALARIGIKERGVARHVARHTFCSWRIQAGFSYGHVGALVGDSAATVERTYSHLSPHHLLAASNIDTSKLRAA